MDATCRPSLLESWNALLRVRRRVLDAVEADLKGQGFPALNECLALVHLRDSERRALRPSDLEILLDAPQYTVSRLIDRLEKSGFVARKACPQDGRSHYAVLTDRGVAEITRFWPAYCVAIEQHLGAHLCDNGAQMLAQWLRQVAPDPADPSSRA
ncbi:MAG: MarR family winged helix-turn-helix transcriptional regulator, partial [Beijerinckiaceae bacterium]